MRDIREWKYCILTIVIATLMWILVFSISCAPRKSVDAGGDAPRLTSLGKGYVPFGPSRVLRPTTKRVVVYFLVGGSTAGGNLTPDKKAELTAISKAIIKPLTALKQVGRNSPIAPYQSCKCSFTVAGAYEVYVHDDHMDGYLFARQSVFVTRIPAATLVPVHPDSVQAAHLRHVGRFKNGGSGKKSIETWKEEH